MTKFRGNKLYKTYQVIEVEFFLKDNIENVADLFGIFYLKYIVV